jgi:hypothetical protein
MTRFETPEQYAAAKDPQRHAPMGSLTKATDRAIADENARYLADTEAQRRDREAAERWAKWTAAEEAAGDTAVVIPVALAKVVMDRLAGDTTSSPLDTNVLIAMLRTHITKAGARS